MVMLDNIQDSIQLVGLALLVKCSNSCEENIQKPGGPGADNWKIWKLVKDSTYSSSNTTRLAMRSWIKYSSPHKAKTYPLESSFQHPYGEEEGEASMLFWL